MGLTWQRLQPGEVNRRFSSQVCGSLLRFAYIEFSDKESVRTSLALDESLFRGRQIKVSAVPLLPWLWAKHRGDSEALCSARLNSQVIPKRTNRPGISTTDRGFPRARYRARTTNYNSSRSRFYSGFNSRPRGRIYRSG